MDIIQYNFSWMTYNLFLAVLPVIFSWIMFRIPNRFLAGIIGLLWFIYLPNTIYIFTDLHHLIEQWGAVDFLGKIIIFAQYTMLEVIGLWCFLVAFYPVEIILRKLRFSHIQRIISIIGVNFLLGFAMVLGKVERVNSWDIFTNPLFVFSSIINILSSLPMLGLIFLFGLFANFFYFLFRGWTQKVLSNKWIMQA